MRRAIEPASCGFRLSGGTRCSKRTRNGSSASWPPSSATAETLIVADYRGLTNKQLESLRDVLLEHGARFRIVKNTLTRRAAEQAGADALLVMLEGPTAIAFIESSGDPAAVAKALQATAQGDERPRAPRRDPRGEDALERGGRTARDAPARGRPPQPARGGDRRPADAAARARLGSAHRPGRAHRRPDQAARGAGRGRAGGSGRRGGRGADRRAGRRRAHGGTRGSRAAVSDEAPADSEPEAEAEPEAAEEPAPAEEPTAEADTDSAEEASSEDDDTSSEDTSDGEEAE